MITIMYQMNESNSRAFLLGESVFTTMKIHLGNCIFLQDHLQRLGKGVEFLFQELLPESLEEECINAARVINNGSLRITIFKQQGAGGFLDRTGELDIALIIKRGEENLFNFGSAIKVTIAQSRKISNLLPSFLKKSDYLVSIQEKMNARDKGYDDCLFLDENEMLTEVTTSNILFRKKELFISPPPSSKVLEGITLKNLKIGLERENYQVLFKEINRSDLDSMDQCWILNSIEGVVSVENIDRKSFELDSKWSNKLREILINEALHE